MGYDVAIWGKLKFPAGKIDEWNKLVVDGSAWDDWQMWFEPSASSEPRTVAAHLAAWAELGGETGPRFFEAKADEPTVEIRAFLSDTDFVAEAHDLAATFRTAARVGATGKVTFAGVATSLGYEVVLSKSGKSKFSPVDEDLEESAPVLRILTQARNREIKGLAAGPMPSLSEVAGQEPVTAGLPPEVATLMREVHARLEAADPTALLAASKKLYSSVQVRGKSANVREVFKTRDAVLVGLRGLSGKTTAEEVGALHEATIELLALVDPAAAEPILVKILGSSAPQPLRSRAAFSLTGMRSDATVDALFASLHEPGFEMGGLYYNPIRRGAENALGETGRADVGERALALLTPKALDIPSSRRAVRPDFEAHAKEDFVHAPLVILHALKYRPARERLTAIFRKHKIDHVRSLAGHAIVASATPEELRGAFGEEQPETWHLDTIERFLDHLAREKKAG